MASTTADAPARTQVVTTNPVYGLLDARGRRVDLGAPVREFFEDCLAAQRRPILRTDAGATLSPATVSWLRALAGFWTTRADAVRSREVQTGVVVEDPIELFETTAAAPEPPETDYQHATVMLDLGLGLLGAVGYIGSAKYRNGGPRGADELLEKLRGSDDPFSNWLAEQLARGRTAVLPLAGGGLSMSTEEAVERWQKEPWAVGTESALAWLMMLVPGPKGVTRGFPSSPGKAAMVQAMADAAGLYQTGAGWYIRGGIKVADVSGNWLSHKVNPSLVPDYPNPGKRRRN